MPMKQTEPRPGRVLFVMDPYLGHITFHTRGVMFRELFEKAGWDVAYTLVAQPPEHRNRTARRRREDEIVAMSADYDAVYLLKVSSFRLADRLKRGGRVRVIFDLTDALCVASYLAIVYKTATSADSSSATTRKA